MNGNRQQGNRGQMPPPPAVAQVAAADLLPPEPVVEAPVEKSVASPEGPFTVVATRKGFFGHKRRAEGEKFQINSLDQLGSWMKLADPKAEAERQKKAKEKKNAGK